MSDIYSFLENTAVFELNQEEGHTSSISYMSVNEALINNRDNCANYLTLNGKWKFHYSDIPEDAIPGFSDRNFNDTKWSTIEVPSNWEMQARVPATPMSLPTPFAGPIPVTLHSAIG